MANFYTKFSFSLPLTTDEQILWARQAVSVLNRADDCEMDHEAIELSALSDDELARYRELEEYGAPEVEGDERYELAKMAGYPHPMLNILPDDDYSVSYSRGVERNGNDQSLWLFSEESGRPEHVVPLVQDYLRRFHPQGHVGFEWANTCDRPREDAFGGGAVFITVNDAKWMSSGTWLSQKYTDAIRHDAGARV